MTGKALAIKALAVKTLVYLTLTLGVIGIVFCLVYNAVYPTDEYVAADRQNQNKTAQRGDQISAIQQANPEPQDEATQNKQSPFREWLGKWSEPITLLTLALVIGVIVTNCIYYGQLKKMRETVALVAGQSETMKESLAETRNIVIQNERAIELGNRAYITIDAASLLDLEAGKKVCVGLSFKNSGKTPAYEILIAVCIDIAETCPAEPLIDEAQLQGSKGILGPDIAYGNRYWSQEVVSKERLDLILNKKLRIFSRGAIFYVDILGRKRWTKFCMCQSPYPLTDPKLLSPCPDGNEAN